MKQFIKVSEDYFKDENLKGCEILLMSMLEDRMESSIQRPEFFDKKMGDHFVIYTREELSKKLGLNLGTITNMFKKLVNKGYLVIKHQFNGASKLFLPKFNHETSNDNVSSKFELPKSENFISNHRTNSNKQITDNTNDTCSRTNSPKDSNITQKPDQNKVIKQAELDVIANSLVTKVHLPKQAVNIMKTFSFGDPKKLYSYAGLLFKAKSAVSKQAKSVQNAQEALSFELNTDYQETLDTDLKRIIVSANKKTSQPDGYMMTSLIDMFQNKVNDYCSHDIQSVIS
ncbi:replication initiator protein A [Lentilactobacillus buchneri]|uniref:replication initiator protein A n=1 Tax=Lentilactobacillus buchneri TaxID=1581 RepID=UPI0012919AE3|nr:replication initiator protein A [Lentilactobacillus buchneri]MQM59310.1 replication initiator protein A [Lentilactobacillus buchneri]MQM83807.1 replication initiator protein A [Lentilactobacillus buchneri]